MLACVGCSPPDTGAARLDFDGALHARDEQLILLGRIGFEPGPEVRTALESGVDLTLSLEIRQRNSLGPLQWSRQVQEHKIRMGYLPLTEQWWLERSGEREIFARLWLLLDALARPEGYATGQPADADFGAFTARIRLDRSALPPPMQLPALLSPAWRLASPKWQPQPAAS